MNQWNSPIPRHDPRQEPCLGAEEMRAAADEVPEWVWPPPRCGLEPHRQVYCSFLIAGFAYYAGAKAFPKLYVGRRLRLRADPQNRYDEYAIGVYCLQQQLGYVPRKMNRELALILNAGHSIFRAVVQQLDPAAHPARQVRVAVYLKKKGPTPALA
ncbi:MAG: HIRAN domain-containing protein [Leptospiraceae bacterium]|nr:HIRAN domain-containing protein [Leptospiraceae bacterium]